MELLAILTFAFLLSVRGGPVPQSQLMLQEEHEAPGNQFVVPQLSDDADPDFEVPSCSPFGGSCSHSNSVPARGLSAADEQRHLELQELVREMENRSTPLTSDEQRLLNRHYQQLLSESLKLEVKALLDKCAHSLFVLEQTSQAHAACTSKEMSIRYEYSTVNLYSVQCARTRAQDHQADAGLRRRGGRGARWGHAGAAPTGARGARGERAGARAQEHLLLRFRLLLRLRPACGLVRGARVDPVAPLSARR